MSLSQRKVEEYNPFFYEEILPYVFLMPDFRPPETMRRMKAEKQDSWGRILNELEAVGYDEEHMAIIDMINSGSKKELEKWIESETIISEFIFSYPALVWLMLQVSPRETIIPLLVSQGKYLKEIPIIKEDVAYIRNEKTAKKLRKLYPSLITDEEILNRGKRDFLEKGYLYWLIVGPFRGIEDINYYNENILSSLAKSEDIHLLSLFVPSSPGTFLLYELISANFIAGVDYIFNMRKFSYESLEVYLLFAIEGGNVDITLLLLNNFEKDLSRHSLEEIVNKIQYINDIVFLNALFEHPRTKEIVTLLWELDLFYPLRAIKLNNIALMKVFLQQMEEEGEFPHDINIFVKLAIQLKRKEILHLLLNVDYDNIKIHLLKEAKELLEENELPL